MEKIAFTNLNMYDGKKDSDLQSNMTIIIEFDQTGKEKKGVITEIGPSEKINVPSKSQIIDLMGKYVIPGLINVHCHLTADGKPMTVTQGGESKMNLLKKFLGSQLGRAYVKSKMKRNVLAALNSGVTTIRNAGDPEYYDVEIRNAVEKNKIQGPRLVVTGRSICVTGGHGELMSHIIDSPWEGRKAVRHCLRHGSDVIKILSTGGVMDAKQIGEAGRAQMTVEEISAICDEAHRAGVNVMTHCESTLGIKEALLGGVDSIEHGAQITDELIALFKNNPKTLNGYTTLVSTVSAPLDLCELGAKVLKITDVVQQNAEIIRDGLLEGLKTAIESGIPVAMGTDAAVPFVAHYEFWKELLYYQHFTGISNKQAINIATEQNSKLIGVNEITGTLESGKAADFVVYDQNPLENLLALEHPYKVVYRGNIIHKPSYKKVKALEKFASDRFFTKYILNKKK
jgi:imidazolonepropionase-like amidohydrolase